MGRISQMIRLINDSAWQMGMACRVEEGYDVVIAQFRIPVKGGFLQKEFQWDTPKILQNADWQGVVTADLCGVGNSFDRMAGMAA